MKLEGIMAGILAKVIPEYCYDQLNSSYYKLHWIKWYSYHILSFLSYNLNSQSFPLCDDVSMAVELPRVMSR